MTYTFKIYHEHHIVLLRETGHKFDFNFRLLASFKPSSIVLDVELRLLRISTVSRHSNHVVDVYF